VHAARAFVFKYCLLSGLLYSYKDSHRTSVLSSGLSQDFCTVIMSRITKRKQKSHHTRKENPTSSLKMNKPGRETKEKSVEQDSDTKKCNTLHNNTHLCEPPHSILNCLYGGPSIDHNHTPAYTCSGHSNEPSAESAIINISRPASLSSYSLLVNEKKNDSPVMHAASSHQAWKIGANQQLYIETQSQNSHSCQIHAIIILWAWQTCHTI